MYKRFPVGRFDEIILTEVNKRILHVFALSLVLPDSVDAVIKVVRLHCDVSDKCPPLRSL